MPRKNYMTINAHETVQQVFDEFVERKELTKTVALNDMLEMYMIAKDEELYMELKRKYLNIESIRQMILDRDDDTLKTNDNIFIFMKLSHSVDNNGNKYNGHETMQAYINDQSLRGYTWFSTQALYYGMSPKRVKEYSQRILQGDKVTILFGIGKSAGGENDIAYTANVVKIKSFVNPTSIDCEEYPELWRGEKARIWLKINDLKPETQLSARLFKITSSNADLYDVICKSQYQFGYVSYK